MRAITSQTLRQFLPVLLLGLAVQVYATRGGGDGEGNGRGNSGNENNAGEGAQGQSEEGDPFPDSMLVAHGVMASLAFVVFFPFGAIAIRVSSFPGIVWIHGIFQIFSYALYTAAFGLGVHMARLDGYLNTYHAIIGMVVFSLLFFQPILGVLHHLGFKKTQGRTFWSHLHLWIGRSAITLGIINGGLGMKMSGYDGPGRIVYGVFAGLIWMVWMTAAVVGEFKRVTNVREKRKKEAESSDQA